MSEPRPMSLDQALRILVDVHTKDDAQTGFVFLVGATPDRFMSPWSPADHIEAWKTVREHLHMQTEPQEK